MEFIADFHIHSRYSRATSRDLNLEGLHRAAQRKGVSVLGTGDFTHPEWMQEIREKLVPAEDGLYRLRDDLARAVEAEVPPSCRGEVRFLLTSEISSIYKRDGQVRKVHNLLFFPSVETAAALSGRLERIGNLASDGRPILGLDSRHLLEMVLETTPEAYLVPAHIWTPWFSVLGSRSGFDSVEACYGDLTGEIFSVETGLSSDPAMNGRLSALDRFTLMSNSDAHSAAKVGREANRFACARSFPAIRAALRAGRDGGFLGTIEFFPEQGKYHLDGHRKCACRMEPTETLDRGGLCPVCGKGVTVGVMHRVEALADRPEGEGPPDTPPYDRLVSLEEVVGEVKGAGPGTKGVRAVCGELTQRLGPELEVLRTVPTEEIEREGGGLLAEAIRRMRRGEVFLEAGYDGAFGVVRLFRPGEREERAGQMLLTGLPEPPKRRCGGKAGARAKRDRPVGATAAAGGAPAPDAPGESSETSAAPGPPRLEGAPGPLFVPESRSLWSAELMERLNPEQREAVVHAGSPLLIVAGPGTGKTMTLTCRIAYLIQEREYPADRILAVTFTQRAAREMEERLRALLGESAGGGAVRVRTFHALGAELLRELGPAAGLPGDFFVLGAGEPVRVLRQAVPSLSHRAAEAFLERISEAKRNLREPEACEAGAGGLEFRRVFRAYEEALRSYGSLDYDDLVSGAVRVLERVRASGEAVPTPFAAVCVDEYQDVNLAQYRMLRLLCGGVRDLCVIGDPDQAIYGFRGASPDYFRRFTEDHPGARTVRLVRNYRSGESILAASATMLSARRTGEPPPRLEAAAPDPGRIQIVELASEKAEAIFVAQTIEQLMGGTDSLSLYADKVDAGAAAACGSFGEIAVLCRLKAQVPALEKAFQYQGIPYQSTREADQWRGREGRTLLALIRWMKDPRDRLAWEQVAEAVKGAPGDLEDRMRRYREDCFRERLPLPQALRDLPVLDGLPLSGEGGWASAWESLLRLAAGHGSDWDGLLRSLTFSRDADFVDRVLERVILTTLHAAKGLEFPVVFIAGCEDHLLPCETGAGPSDPEEERRLFYVGMTRSCRRLYLTRARGRFLHGVRRSCEPSPFLADLPADRVERVRISAATGKRSEGDLQQPSLFKLP